MGHLLVSDLKARKLRQASTTDWPRQKLSDGFVRLNRLRSIWGQLKPLDRYSNSPRLSARPEDGRLRVQFKPPSRRLRYRVAAVTVPATVCSGVREPVTGWGEGKGRGRYLRSRVVIHEAGRLAGVVAGTVRLPSTPDAVPGGRHPNCRPAPTTHSQRPPGRRNCRQRHRQSRLK